jgi:hypothetical protein
MNKLLMPFLALLIAACQPALPPPVTPAVTATLTFIIPGPTSTPRPIATFTPAPPTPLPRFFTEEFEGALPGWSMLQSNADSVPRTRLEEGALIVDMERPYQWAYIILGTEEYGEARLDALVQSRGTGPEALGLICRYSEANGWYEFNISSDGSYNVLFGQWLEQGLATYAPIASADSEYLQRGAEKNEIGLACQEDTLWLYLNGKLFRKLDVSRFGLKEGRLGLAIASFENLPVTAAIDWVRVSAP